MNELGVLLDEVRRRQVLRPFAYGLSVVGANQKVEEFWRRPEKIRCLFGANRSGKTHTATLDMIWTALGEHPYEKKTYPHLTPPVNLRLHIPDFSIWEKVHQKKYASYVPTHALKGGSWKKAMDDRMHILTFANGSTLDITTHDTDLISLGGASLHKIHIDEECSEKQFKELLLRIVDTRGRIVITATFVNGLTWLYHLWKRKDSETVWAEKMSIYENKFLSKEQISEIESLIVDERERRVRLGGEILPLTGLVFSEFADRHKRSSDEDYPDPNWFWIVGLDYGRKHNSAAVWLAVDPNEKKIETVYSVKVPHLDLVEFGKVVVDTNTALGIDPEVCVDSQLYQVDTRGHRPVDDLIALGLSVFPATKRERESIGWVNSLLRNDKLFVNERCVSLIERIVSLGWKEGVHGVVTEDSDNDETDAWRYGIYFAKKYLQDEEEVEMSELDALISGFEGLTTGMALLSERNRKKRDNQVFLSTGYGYLSNY